jgi:hypothetical protein
MGNREKAICDRLQKWEEEFQAGRKDRFLDVMNLCLSFDMKVPPWAAAYFCKGAARYETAEARTLDEAFDIKRPKGWNKSRERQYRRWGMVAAMRMYYLVSNKGISVKKAAAMVVEGYSVELENSTERVEGIHMDAATAERWYYDKRLRDQLGYPQKSKKTADD